MPSNKWTNDRISDVLVFLCAEECYPTENDLTTEKFDELIKLWNGFEVVTIEKCLAPSDVNPFFSYLSQAASKN